MSEKQEHLLPFFYEFKAHLQNNNYSKETISNYLRDLDIFAAFLNLRRLKFAGIDKLTISEYKGFLRNDNYIPVLQAFKADIEVTDEVELESKDARTEIQKAQYSGRLSSKSVNRMLSSLRSYFNFLVDIDEDIPLPPSAIKLVKSEKKQKQIPELEEMIRLIESPQELEKSKLVGIRNQAIMELIFATGMRISEIVNLDLEHMRIDNRRVQDDRIYIMGKGKKQRFVYLTPRAIKAIEAYLEFREDEYPALFIPTKGTRRATGNPYIVRLSQNYIQSKIAEYRRRLGIIVPTSAHSLRHGFATYLAEEGASPAAIQHLLGHESLQTTTRYVHASDRFAEDAHRKHHPLQQ